MLKMFTLLTGCLGKPKLRKVKVKKKYHKDNLLSTYCYWV